MRLRVLDTGLAPARWNAAASAALLAGGDADRDAVLRFHRFHPSCVLGRFQDVGQELDLAGCHATGVTIARRVTGGGAVVMGPGILAFDLVVPGRNAAPATVAERAGTALAATLVDLGYETSRPTAGSVAIDGRKVSGSAGRLGRRAMLHQATLILDLAKAPPLSLLRRRTEGGKPTADPRHRVTDLRTALCAEQRAHVEVGEAVMRQLTSRLAQTLDLEPGPDGMSDEERARAAAILADTVGREDFVVTGDVERRAA